MQKYFPALVKYKNFIFCENAGGSQVPVQVCKKINNFIESNYIQPGVNNLLSKKLTNDLNEINNITNTILNNKNGNIIYGSSTSQLVYNLANGLENYLINNKENEIILNNFNHESCISPFERIANKNNLKINWWNLNNFEINYNDILNKVNKNTKLVVLPHSSNILGNTFNIKFINNEIKKINPNTLTLVDGVATLAHNLIDVNDLDIDFYLISFYKFCGMRISVLYSKDKNLNQVENQNHYFLEKNSNQKLEIGGFNYENAISIIGLKDYLIDYYYYYYNSKINKLNRKDFCKIMNNIKSTEEQLINRFRKNLKNNNEITIIESKNSEKNPIFSLDFKNYNLNNINLILNELGIICKNSTFYCERFFDKYKLNKNSGLLRLSFMHYNTISEIDKICQYLNLFKKENLIFCFAEHYFNNNKEFQNSFNFIKKDNYYHNKRNRAFSLLKVTDKIEIIGNLHFYQSEIYNNINGNYLREYENINSNILDNSLFKDIIFKFNNLVSEQLNIKNKYIQIHKIRVYADQNSTNLVPEGIHQDGFNLIAIYCSKRENIKGGINNIYDKNKNIIYSKELKEGEMIILNDNKNYHDVTNIELVDKNNEGYRDVIILTTIS